MTRTADNPTRRDALKAIAAGTTAALAAVSLPAIASAEPIITLCADALRLCDAWNKATSTYARAADAAQEDGYPTGRPEIQRTELSDAEVYALAIGGFLKAAAEDPGSVSAAKVAELEDAAERAKGPAAKAKAARQRHEARAHRAELKRWEEADARFGITAALAASDAAGARAYAAIDAVDAATIASAAGAFAVFALGHYLIEDGDDERARPLFEKARAYVDRAGILGADFPAARQIMTSPEGGDA